MPSQAPKLLERSVQRACLRLLYQRHIFHYRNNTGAVTRVSRGRARTVHFGVRGGPDIIAVVKGQFWGIECKSAKGRQTDDQKVFERVLTNAGGRYLLVRDVQELTDALNAVV